ncbi:hypothetical protein AnigIFM63309_009779 [Aspergillus niger]|nr:hypothetical protein AnigIFM63309_009779 [Aspergillus niger]
MSLWRAISSSTKSSSMGSDIPSTTSRITQNAQKFPTSGFDIIQPDEKVEEEELPDYEARHFYPVRLGEIFQNRYQVVAKLGFGSSATTWLSRDLTNGHYVALKVHVHTSSFHREVLFYNHVKQQLQTSSHQERYNIGKLLNSFIVSSQDGTHTVLIFQAAQMSLRDMKVVFQQGGFDEDLVKGAITELLQAVDFLHTQGQSVHTGKEFFPSCSTSQAGLSRADYLFITPDASSRPHGGDIMPLEYRAPETLLYIDWSYPVDIWSAWDLLEPRKLFTARDEDGGLYDAAHLAQIIAALGPPPPRFSKKEPGKGKRFLGL